MKTQQQGWLRRPRSLKWKLSACFMWTAICALAAVAASIGFSLYLDGTNYSPAVQLQACRQFGAAITPGLLMIVCSGIVLIARRPRI